MSDDYSTTLIVSAIGVGSLAFASIFLAVQRVPRTGGTVLIDHVLFLIGAIAVILVLPLHMRKLIFSPFGVRIVGTLFPLYESIRAVCTPEEEDDKVWLQYWVAQGVVFYSSEWVEDLAVGNDTLYIWFYHFEFFFYLWLFLPYTDGASLIFEKLTKPYLAPFLKPVTNKFEYVLNNAVSSFVSVAHIWVVWAVFLFFPPTLKRFVTVSVGTIYPLLASVAALITPTHEDDTFWLTYWSCFGILYIIMDWLDNYIGAFPGFYMAVLFCTIYLMIPIINGAEKVFRKILVPLAGLQDMLLLRDAIRLKEDIEKHIPESSRNAKMRKQLVSIFNDMDDKKKKGSTSVSSAGETTGLFHRPNLKQEVSSRMMNLNKDDEDDGGNDNYNAV